VSTILIADASAALRRMLCSLLEIRDYSIIEAGNGEQVMESLQRQTERIIALLDSALTAAGTPIVGALAANPHLLSQHAFVVMHPHFEQPELSPLPASFHLEKPFTVDALHDVINQANAQLVHCPV
jgi:CheY-like chemotaxis protein